MKIIDQDRKTLGCKCGGETAVLEGRPSPNSSYRRRRECTSCGLRFTTYECERSVLDFRLQLECYAKALKDIVSCDYRGNMPAEQLIAKRALESRYANQGDKNG